MHRYEACEQERVPVRLARQPLSVDLAVGGQVVYALHIRQPCPLLSCVMMIDTLPKQQVMMRDT
jgi:hypothetical protein